MKKKLFVSFLTCLGMREGVTYAIHALFMG